MGHCILEADLVATAKGKLSPFVLYLILRGLCFKSLQVVLLHLESRYNLIVSLKPVTV